MNWFFLAVIFYLVKGDMEVHQFVDSQKRESKESCMLVMKSWTEKVVETKPSSVDILWIEADCISRPIEGQVRM